MMCKVIEWLRELFFGKKPPPPADEKTKKRGSLKKPFCEKDKNAPPFSKNDTNNAEEQNKRAIAVEPAAAAGVEAAEIAARAALAVVKFTSTEKMTSGENRVEFAAVKIQAAFRAYLARRALVALKGLVKLQALVRGNIVRKQTAESFRCMQALIRVQQRARACRAIRSEIIHRTLSSRAETDPKTTGKHELVRANAHMLGRSSTLKNYPSSHTSTNDQMLKEHFSRPAKTTPTDDEYNAKILEIDLGKPLHSKKSKRKIKFSQSFSPMTSDHTQSSTTVPDSSKDSSIAQPFSNPENYNVEGSSQFFSASSSRVESSKKEPSLAKSKFSRSFYSEFSDHPRYMANTESYKAKAVRSHSAPKQRPELKLGSVRRHLAKRSSLMFSKNVYMGSGRLDELGMSVLRV